MPRTKSSLLDTDPYLLTDRMNQILIENLNAAAWRATLPGAKVRTIAAIFSHVHNIRRKWLRLSAAHLKIPAPLHHATCTPEQTRAALQHSAARCSEMLADALSSSPKLVKSFHRDGWAQPWPAGPSMLAYMLSHDAHHRGQACMLAHQLGFPLPSKVTSVMWDWKKLSKD
jgi:uncharacterized damage-inducible protein DinB